MKALPRTAIPRGATRSVATAANPTRACVAAREQRRLSRVPAPAAPFTSPPPPPRRLAHTTTLHDRQSSLFKFSSDTIYALSSAEGRAGIAVIRISGPSALSILSSLAPSRPAPRPRQAVVRTLVDPDAPAVVLDTAALVLYFAAPRSVTGEDVVELHVHGGTATVRAVLAAIPRCRSSSSSSSSSNNNNSSSSSSKTGAASAPARYAAPGEFTRRAFFNGRMDLSQVEALGDTLSAATERQRRAAVRGSSARLGETYDRWQDMLVSARGELEALIDFSEDQAFDESSALLMGNTARQVEALLRSMAHHEAGARRGELLRRGISVALLGPVNVGKSSLMNAIVGREASIVSGEAGTTRDVVEASLDVGGYLCSFADTAGIRGGEREGAGGEAIGKVEQEGIRRARVKAGEADVVVVMAAVEPAEDNGWAITYDDETLALAAGAKAALVVVNKCDAVEDGPTLQGLLADFHAHVRAAHPALAEAAAPLAISCHAADVALPPVHYTPQDEAASDAAAPSRFSRTDPGGVHALTTALIARFAALTDMPASAGEDPDQDADQDHLLGVTERQRQLLVECRHHLDAFLAEARRAVACEGDEDVVLAAEFLRFAAKCLARITGRGEAGGDVEEVLGVVFERFCVGK